MANSKASMSVAVAIAVSAVSVMPAAAEAEAMIVRIRLNGAEITATLADNATSRDFASLLPLELTLEDHGATEKISYLPRRLSTEGAPAGSDPSAGDVAYYAPWGNLALYREDFGYSAGLVKLGRIETGSEMLNVPGKVKATIELIGNEK